MLNKQPIEKRVEHPDGLVEVHSVFYTIQGEGPFCGTPAVFVRLAGCNLQCPWCDTEYTATRTLLNPRSVLSMVQMALDAGTVGPENHLDPTGQLVVITGGEPFRQNLSQLLHELVTAGFYVQIETNGTLPPSRFDYSVNINNRSGAYIVCSPKTGKVNPLVWSQACCVKYVMAADDESHDGLPTQALGHTANPILARPPVTWPASMIYLQPMDAKDYDENNRNVMAVRDSCLRNGYILQLQIHKLIGVE